MEVSPNAFLFPCLYHYLPVENPTEFYIQFKDDSFYFSSSITISLWLMHLLQKRYVVMNT